MNNILNILNITNIILSSFMTVSVARYIGHPLPHGAVKLGGSTIMEQFRIIAVKIANDHTRICLLHQTPSPLNP